MASQSDPLRVTRLKKTFLDFMNGRRNIVSSRDAELFLEAAQCHSTPHQVIETIIHSQHGRDAVRQSVRISSTSAFICRHVLPFLLYFDTPETKAINEGAFLQELVACVIEPPTTWKPMLQLYVDSGFSDNDVALRAFAWLCLQVASQSASLPAATVEDVASSIKAKDFIQSSDQKVKELGYQIQKALQVNTSSLVYTNGNDGPGGRHDNDFEDFRQISVFATRDELQSTRLPFYRRASEIADLDPGHRSQAHLDNQFRLLREDMLDELREDINEAFGPKKGRRSAQRLGGLQPTSIDAGNNKRGNTCALVFSVSSGLGLSGFKTEAERLAYLKGNKSFLRHDSFGVLCHEKTVIGFARLVRDENRLAGGSPKVVLKLTADQQWSEVLISLTKGGDVSFILIDTPIFAYEPVLERLKSMQTIPLENHLISYDQQSNEDGGSFVPGPLVRERARFLEAQSGAESAFRVERQKYVLDQDQREALIAILKKPCSIVQGPPGTSRPSHMSIMMHC